MIRCLMLVLLMLPAMPGRVAQGAPTDDAALQAMRQPGAVGLLRHAQAPGVGDPAEFRLGDCSTQDTAALLGLGPVQVMPALNSFFSESTAAPGQTAAVRQFIATWNDPPLLLMTHQLNVTALTGLVPRDGELIVIRPGPAGLTLAGRVQPARP